jgi:hypothetical protein
MALDVDEQSRVNTLGVELQKQFTDYAKTAPQPVEVPLFIKHANGSVSTRDGRVLRGPTEPTPATGK